MSRRAFPAVLHDLLIRPLDDQRRGSTMEVGGHDRLGIDHRRGGLRGMPGQYPDLFTQRITHREGDTSLLAGVHVATDGLSVRSASRRRLPHAPVTHQVAERFAGNPSPLAARRSNSAPNRGPAPPSRSPPASRRSSPKDRHCPPRSAAVRLSVKHAALITECCEPGVARLLTRLFDREKENRAIARTSGRNSAEAA